MLWTLSKYVDDIYWLYCVYVCVRVCLLKKLATEDSYKTYQWCLPSLETVLVAREVLEENVVVEVRDLSFCGPVRQLDASN